MADIVGKSKIYGSREEAINSLYNETHAQYSSGDYSWHPKYDGNHRFCRYYDEDGKIRTIFVIEHAPEGVYQGGVESMEVFADCEVYTFAQGTSAVTSCSSSEIIETITTLQNTVETLETKITELETRLNECCFDDSRFLKFTNTLTDDTSRISMSFSDDTANRPIIYYAKNGGNTYVEWDYTEIALGPGESVKMYGDNDIVFNDLVHYAYFVMVGKIAATGDIMSLVSKTLLDYLDGISFAHLFKDCVSLISAPELGALTLSPNCYAELFEGCTNLTQIPELPADELANSCYYGMFSGCTQIDPGTAVLPATTLAPACYMYMFKGCTGLMDFPELPAMTATSMCYYGMFESAGSTSTGGNGPKISLPATHLASECYAYMFKDTPFLGSLFGHDLVLPAASLAAGCYEGMFQNSKHTIFNYENMLPATSLATSCYKNMFNGSNIADMVKLPATVLSESCYEGMFQNCVLFKPSAKINLAATILAKKCYKSMFMGCTQMNAFPVICEGEQISFPEECCSTMFANCTSATALWSNGIYDMENVGKMVGQRCCENMFRDCDNLEKIKLPKVATLTDYCYVQMFYSCRKLNEIWCASENTGNNSTSSWVLELYVSNGTFHKSDYADFWTSQSDSGIPQGWTVQSGYNIE